MKAIFVLGVVFMVLALGMCAPSPLPLPRARPNPQLLTGMPIMTDFYASPVMGLDYGYAII